MWGAIAAGGGAFGLLLGGILTDALLVGVDLLRQRAGRHRRRRCSRVRYIPESRAEKRPDSFDVAGAVTVTAGLIVLVYAIVKAEEYGWGSTKTFGLGARRDRAAGGLRR